MIQSYSLRALARRCHKGPQQESYSMRLHTLKMHAQHHVGIFQTTHLSVLVSDWLSCFLPFGLVKMVSDFLSKIELTVICPAAGVSLTGFYTEFCFLRKISHYNEAGKGSGDVPPLVCLWFVRKIAFYAEFRFARRPAPLALRHGIRPRDVSGPGGPGSSRWNWTASSADLPTCDSREQ